jgi:hypothetical protein
VRERRRVILVVTVAADDVAGNAFRRLLGSLGDQAVEISAHVVIRGEPKAPVPSPVPCWDGDLVLHRAPAGAALSCARNIALRHLASSGEIARADAVAFPDDDCWYPPRLLSAVGQRLADWDIVMGSYSAQPPNLDFVRFSDIPGELDWRQAYEQTASITQFHRGAVVHDVGAFDERFGVGARYPSAEDADYLVRAIQRGWRCFYDPSLVVGHRRREAPYGSHYVGGTALLAKHAVRVPIARRLLARSLLAGARRTASGALPAGTYAGTLRAVVATFGRTA